MTARFSPDWRKVQRPLAELLETLAGNDHLLVEAFVAATNSAPRVQPDLSVDDVRDHLHAAVMNRAIPWVLYDTVSNLIKRLPKSGRMPIIETFCLDTGHRGELLRPTEQGYWQVLWKSNNGQDDEDDPLSLSWYAPPNHDKAPLVPEFIIDYISGCISLLNDGHLLPAAALLSIALESALWDELAAKGTARTTERITYATTNWQFKRLHDKLLVTIEGSDHSIQDLDAVAGIYPANGVIEVRKSQTDPANDKAILRAEVDARLIGYFASETEVLKELIQEKGLSEAMQRARKANILRTIPFQSDETIIKLRNNLIHLPAQGILDPAIPLPGGGELTSLNDVQNEQQLVNHLVYLGVDLINTIYLNR